MRINMWTWRFWGVSFFHGGFSFGAEQRESLNVLKRLGRGESAWSHFNLLSLPAARTFFSPQYRTLSCKYTHEEVTTMSAFKVNYFDNRFLSPPPASFLFHFVHETKVWPCVCCVDWKHWRNEKFYFFNSIRNSETDQMKGVHRRCHKTTNPQWKGKRECLALTITNLICNEAIRVQSFRTNVSCKVFRKMCPASETSFALFRSSRLATVNGRKRIRVDKNFLPTPADVTQTRHSQGAICATLRKTRDDGVLCSAASYSAKRVNLFLVARTTRMNSTELCHWVVCLYVLYSFWVCALAMQCDYTTDESENGWRRRRAPRPAEKC